MKPSPHNLALGKALRARRQQLGLSQIQLCDLAGVGPVFLHDLERGKPTLRLDKLLVVLEVLGLGLELRESHSPLISELLMEEAER
jgi:HTH-type transcriptional regulator / antitoxin HipB